MGQLNESLVVALQIIGIATGLTGSVMNAQRRVAGFYYWFASNMVMVVLNAMMGLYGMVILFFVYGVICVVGIKNWKRETRAALRGSKALCLARDVRGVNKQ